MEQAEVLVLGGGLSGLATAWWLARSGIATEVWEQDGRGGGKIATRRAGGYVTERGASLMLNYRAEVRTLLKASGLESRKLFPQSAARQHRHLVQDDRLVEVPMRAAAILCSPMWSWRGRLRLLAEPFVARGGHEDETVSEFVCRRLGREFLDKAMEPFVAGVLAADPDRAHARATFPRLSALEERYGSLGLALCAHKLSRHPTPSAETFSFDRGMEVLTDTLARASGVALRTHHRVTAVHPLKLGWRVTAATAQGERIQTARHLVLSLPADAAAGLLRPGDPELARLLDRIEYAPLAVVHLGFDRSAIVHSLLGMGCLVPRREESALTGVQWISSLFPDRAPPGKVLLSAYLGGARFAQVQDWDERRCVDATMQALRRWLGVRSDPEWLWVDRHANALPLYHGAYGARLRAIEQGVRRWCGLHLVANFIGGISTRDRIVCAHAAAERIRQSLQNPCEPPACGAAVSPDAAMGADPRGA